MRYLLGFILFSFLFISCSEKRYDNEYDKFISELERITIADSLRIEFDNSPVKRPLQLMAKEQGQVIVVDASNWTLHLMDQQGKFLDSTGGTGRGPNEYLVISYIHIGTNNQLYVYDGKSKSLSIYSIINDAFQLRDEVALPAYDNGLNLKSIYRTKSEFIGVFKQLIGTSDRDERIFYVYNLGEDLQLKERLVEMPGNEMYWSDRSQIRMENPLGIKTFWGMTGGQFYYTTTNNLSVSSINIQDGSSTKLDLSSVPKPIKDQEVMDFLDKRMRPLFQAEPQLEEIIREGQYLPYFIDFLPTENYFYYTLFFQGSDNGTLLRINKETKEIKKITVPVVFNMYAASEDIVFGIDHTTGGANEILFLELES